jgi:hypothetical protein
MKVKYVLDRNNYSTTIEAAINKVVRDLGSNATVCGDTIVIDDYYERKVARILEWEGCRYSVKY